MRSRSSALDRGRRRLLDQLLVASLHRAVALAEVDRVAVAVGEDLDLDVPRLDDRALEDARRRRRTRAAPPTGRCAAHRRTRVAAATRRMPRPPPPAAALIIIG